MITGKIRRISNVISTITLMGIEGQCQRDDTFEFRRSEYSFESQFEVKGEKAVIET